MAADTEQSHSWVRIGAIYGGVAAGTIVALVYHAGVQRGEQAGSGDEQAEAGPGWYLVWADEPHRHYQLSAPAPPAGAPAAELSKSACWPSRRRARRSRPSLREATTVVRRADSSPDAGQRPVPPGATLRATVTAKEELRRAIEELSEASTRSIASPTIHRGKT